MPIPQSMRCLWKVRTELLMLLFEELVLGAIFHPFAERTYTSDVLNYFVVSCKFFHSPARFVNRRKIIEKLKVSVPIVPLSLIPVLVGVCPHALVNRPLNVSNYSRQEYLHRFFPSWHTCRSSAAGSRIRFGARVSSFRLRSRTGC